MSDQGKGMAMLRLSVLGAAALSISLLSTGDATAEDDVYTGFPVTVKGYGGDKETSVSYSGQIARHTLHESLKKLAGAGAGEANAELKAKMMSYYQGEDAGRAILAPRTKGPFIIAQTGVDEVSKGKNLSGKTFNGTVVGMPNNMTGEELLTFWIDKASAATRGVDADNGYNYPQLISKFIMGAVFYNQVVDVYLDENLSAEKKPNDAPYNEGAAYTGKEHSWDEAFGYFGAPAHTLKLTPREVYEIAKLGATSDNPADTLALADHDKNGEVDLMTEMTFSPAYYAAGFDASAAKVEEETSYLHTITRAFLDGRKLLADANGEKLTDAQRATLKEHAATIADNWEKVFAEATFKYAGSVYKDMMKLQIIMEAGGDISDAYESYIKHWGEVKGFSLALQSGKRNLGEAATRLNRMIGFGPLLPNLSQVVDIDRQGNYVRDQGVSWGEYMLHMVKVQMLMVDEFGIEARHNDMTAELASLAESLGGGESAEND
jgi:hypothetical protein